MLGAVLAGGRSARFGVDKSRVEIGGVALVERVARVLGGVVAEVVIVGGAASEIDEPEPGAGPLQAVVAALEEARRRGYPGVVILACDLPAIDPATVARLAAPLGEGMLARVPRVGGRLQVLAARYEVAALEVLTAAWQGGERSLTRVVAGLGEGRVEARDDWEELALADADTPEALRGIVRAIGRPVAEVEVVREPGGAREVDEVASEEPLEIVVDGAPLAVLLRTPSGVEDDLALAAGFLLAEGVIERRADLDGLGPCEDPAAEHGENRVLVTLAPGVEAPAGARRAFVTGASCGLCGKQAIADLARRLPERRWGARPEAAAIDAMQAAVRARQAGFTATGGLHAAAIFEAERLVELAEDVGRHNAVDKVFGRALRRGELPLSGRCLWVSGRVSFELVQKALVAGVDALVAVGAPTALAVELARNGRLWLVGFARDGRFNVYAGA